MLRTWLEGRTWFRPFHSFYVGIRARLTGHPKWRKLFGTSISNYVNYLFIAKKSPRKILIATSVGGHLPSMTLESMLGVALCNRGVESEYLLCDGILPACMLCEVRWYRDLARFHREGPKVDHCPHCYKPAADALEPLNLTVRRYSDYIDSRKREEARKLSQEVNIHDIRELIVEGVNIGEHVLAGVLRFFARGQLEKGNIYEAILRQYLEASLLTLYATKTLLTQQKYECVVLHHGIYVPQGIVADIAKAMGIRVVIWHSAYRRSCFLFSHDKTYHHTLMSEPVDTWEKVDWSDTLENKIMDYLYSRRVGSNDWIKFQDAKLFEADKIESEIGVDFSRPCIGLLTNVFWDAQLHYPANAFSNMLEWLVKTVVYFANRPELQLLIRIHPAEITGTLPSCQRIMDELLSEFPRLPDNVFVIPAESKISTYVAMECCDSVLIYGTKMGVELASMGIPVIVAGEAWIRGKGISYDINNEDEYYELLDELPFNKRMPPEMTNRARKYAYHFFFRRMIPLDFIVPRRGWPPFKIEINDFDELSPGCQLGLDIICNGILNNEPFIYPDESNICENT